MVSSAATHDSDQIVALLGQLVAFPTESLTPNQSLVDWVGEHLSAFGARVAIVHGPTGRANLLATIGPDSRGGLLLSGHTDVVPAGVGWASPPYELTPADDRVVGRGSADMKGFIACVMVALERLHEKALRCPVHIALSYDEEVGCVGVRGLLDHVRTDPAGEAGVHPDIVVIGEPTMMRPRHAHMGKVAYRLTFTADAAHSSMSPVLPNAISGAVAVVAALEAIAEPYRSSANDPSGDASVTVNVGTIHGGTALNVLSERCEITFELRHTTAFDPDQLLGPLWGAVQARAAALEAAGSGGVEVVEITRYPALSTDTADARVRAVERLADRGRCTPIGYGTEGGLFAAAIDAPVVICGPGDIAVAHRPDEYVSIEQLQACLGFLERLIDEVCVSGDSPVWSAASATG